MSAPQQVPFERPTGLVGPPPWSDEIDGWFKYMEDHHNVNIAALYERYLKLYAEMTNDGWPEKLEEILKKPGIKYFEGLKLRGCICIGIGSFARDLVPIEDYPAEEYWDDNTGTHKFRPAAAVHLPNRDKSMYRFIVLVMLLKFLAEKHDIEETSFYDQWFFGRVDKEFLEFCGFKILHASVTATAELVNPSTLYYAPDASADVIQTVLERCHPAALIGKPLQDVLRYLDDPTGRHPAKPILESYMKVTDFFIAPPVEFQTEEMRKVLMFEVRWLRSQEQKRAWEVFMKGPVAANRA